MAGDAELVRAKTLVASALTRLKAYKFSELADFSLASVVQERILEIQNESAYWDSIVEELRSATEVIRKNG